MNRCLGIVLALGALASVCHAETRWCSIAAHDPSNHLSYPPIARVAQVHGVVLSRIIYATTGLVQRVEQVSGPAMLSTSLSQQLLQWKIKTDAHGEELCQTLVIAEFGLNDSPDPPSERPVAPPPPPGILRLSVDDLVYHIGPCYGGSTRFSIRFALKRAFTRVFPHRG
jgi:hypothetical protein